MEVTDKNLCRICLYSQSKLYLITDTELQEIYEKLTDIKVSNPRAVRVMCFIHPMLCFNFDTYNKKVSIFFIKKY